MKDKSIATLAAEDANASVDYAACREKHQSVVSTYDALVAKVNEWIASLKSGENK